MGRREEEWGGGLVGIPNYLIYVVITNQQNESSIMPFYIHGVSWVEYMYNMATNHPYIHWNYLPELW